MKRLTKLDDRSANNHDQTAAEAQPKPSRAAVEGERSHASNLGAGRATPEWRQLREAVALGGYQSIEAIARILRDRRAKTQA